MAGTGAAELWPWETSLQLRIPRSGPVNAGRTLPQSQGPDTLRPGLQQQIQEQWLVNLSAPEMKWQEAQAPNAHIHLSH